MASALLGASSTPGKGIVPLGLVVRELELGLEFGLEFRSALAGDFAGDSDAVVGVVEVAGAGAGAGESEDDLLESRVGDD